MLYSFYFKLRDACPLRNVRYCPCNIALPARRFLPIATFFGQRGIVADSGARGKRKVCEGGERLSHTVHSFSTNTKSRVSLAINR
jgi:hypothetical protein